MQEGTLEQLLEMGKEFRRQRETLQEEVIGGRMPWLFVEDILKNPPMWAWTLHTQPLQWGSEERLSRAAYSIYASNGLTVCAADESRRIEAISAPPHGVEVVADMSALVTLHQLGQLNNAATYFRKLILPSSYGELPVHDSQRFGQ